MSSFHQELAEFESLMSLNQPLKNVPQTRWERKLASANSSSNGTCALTSNSSVNSGTDRFITNRSSMDTEIQQSLLLNNSSDSMNISSDTLENERNKMRLVQSINSGNYLPNNANTSNLSNNSSTTDYRILSFSNKAPVPTEESSSIRVLYSSSTSAQKNAKSSLSTLRNISSAPVRILDAPDMSDDYYLNLLSWNCNNVLSVGLNNSVYLWDGNTGSTKELLTFSPNDNFVDSNITVTSLSFLPYNSKHLAVGNSNGDIQLWDVESLRQIRLMKGHSNRVSSLSWNSHILSSGSKDSMIIHHDVRVPNHIITYNKGHTQEVCGLSWSPDGTHLASGGNDNLLNIWDIQTCLSSSNPGGLQTSQNSFSQPKYQFRQHQAAVKALAWSPHEKNILLSGGGSLDKTIKIWNINTGNLVNSIETTSQICSIVWSNYEKEFLVAQGYNDNILSLYKYPSLNCVKTLKGHTSRPLHLAASPDGKIICSASSDETIRFWNVFDYDNKKKLNTNDENLMKNSNLRSLNFRIR